MNGIDLALYAIVFLGIVWIWHHISEQFVAWYCDNVKWEEK